MSWNKTTKRELAILIANRAHNESIEKITARLAEAGDAVIDAYFRENKIDPAFWESLPAGIVHRSSMLKVTTDPDKRTYTCVMCTNRNLTANANWYIALIEGDTAKKAYAAFLEIENEYKQAVKERMDMLEEMKRTFAGMTLKRLKDSLPAAYELYERYYGDAPKNLPAVQYAELNTKLESILKLAQAGVA